MSKKKPLPGELSEVDEQGHAQFRCSLCKMVFGIFEVQFYGICHCVCHSCTIQTMIATCEQEQKRLNEESTILNLSVKDHNEWLESIYGKDEH